MFLFFLRYNLIHWNAHILREPFTEFQNLSVCAAWIPIERKIRPGEFQRASSRGFPTASSPPQPVKPLFSCFIHHKLDLPVLVFAAYVVWCFYGFVVVCYASQVSFLFNIMKIFKHTVKWKNLLDWPFDHSKMSFSVSGNNFCLKVCCLILVWTLQLFWLLLAWYFSPILLLSTYSCLWSRRGWLIPRLFLLKVFVSSLFAPTIRNCLRSLEW